MSASDRRVIREVKQRYPDLILLETDGEIMPVRCMVSGLALFESDDLIGDPETGAVLKKAVRLSPEVAFAL
ncbi:hypothetical protein [Hyphomicrobium sp. ghe19]|uniref:hypothetical protein n=1 Tax=Hyphomicrobium sp. ghe19 TaxID=2682968 RepID=UPI0030D1184E